MGTSAFGAFMSAIGKLLNPTLDFLFPGPSSGKSGVLRKQILDLELKKRDYKLQKLLELHERSSRGLAWVGLGTIAYEIIRHFKPKRVVELGSHRGFSTFSIGLALRDLGEGGQIFAVDTWMGDDHTGHYGEDVYEGFMESRRILDLEKTVYPMRMTFEEASRIIMPPIDLLHVDGSHTFRAVTRDFKQFRRHLKPGAIVLFHDVYTFFPQMRFFWALVSRRYPSFLIPYQHGLGVLQIQ
jgi:hypothetical protein